VPSTFADVMEAEDFVVDDAFNKDFWLAQTVGVLVDSVGSMLVLTGKRGRVGQDARWLAASSAAGLAAIDILYAARGRISKVYLADAAIELALVSAWIAHGRGSD
jgi:hypothetical protein